MKIHSYNDISIYVLSKSEHASAIMKLACDVTQKRSFTMAGPLSNKQAEFLVKAGHTSIFEHSSLTILASGISRSLLAQVTRQRHFSFTSASQHYQDYRGYPMSLRPGWDSDARIKSEYEQALDHALQHYIQLIESGEKPEEARQVLPNASTVNLVITANARALFEFLNVRMCRRNTAEMQIFAAKLYTVCCDWLPEIFQFAGPACLEGECNQGAMSCKK